MSGGWEFANHGAQPTRCGVFAMSRLTAPERTYATGVSSFPGGYADVYSNPTVDDHHVYLCTQNQYNQDQEILPDRGGESSPWTGLRGRLCGENSYRTIRVCLLIIPHPRLPSMGIVFILQPERRCHNLSIPMRIHSKRFRTGPPCEAPERAIVCSV